MINIGLFLHNKFEEIEAVAAIDILRRANYNVEIISVENNLEVTGSHGIKIISDINISEANFEKYNGLIIPGGPGIEKLINNDMFLKIITDFYREDKMLGAICAAPQILGKLQLLNNKFITHFPGADKFLLNAKIDLSKPSIIDKNIVTGQSAGTAVQFALNIIEYFEGIERKEKMSKEIVTNYN
ncbi:4-methyl-5(b-hydroxyethyl)-thiazole monophosphate biosynthesis [Williamsoniiplasma somnilux]|uniref:4-methyl-5(B-hydroxyethyl)-thiazole monophosphate biosynthesis n=1 Tax=Williamsoniiplasma somnilux TaxID=215578 RepID=A0A2K8NYH1_9MOLU|nr:DJ-1 family glyoxalase III [Williamsoniiplasma somnilux]ATZ18794.1 4-methyl-5(b-hydroxyethyl)-thiazole monophosphate biosynthesis [Williamsoniiplasma somnilux]